MNNPFNPGNQNKQSEVRGREEERMVLSDFHDRVQENLRYHQEQRLKEKREQTRRILSVVGASIAAFILVWIVIAGPDTIDQYTRTRGMELYNQKEYLQAIQYLDISILVRDRPDTRFYLAESYFQTNKLVKAEVHFSTLLYNYPSLEPTVKTKVQSRLIETCLTLGENQYASKNYSSGKNYLEKARIADPKSEWFTKHELAMKKAKKLVDRKEYLKAIFYTNIAVDAAPGNSDALLMRSSLFIAIDKPDEALQDVRKAIHSNTTLAKDPRVIQLRKVLGEIYETKAKTYLKDSPHQLATYTKAIDADPRNPHYYFRRGNIYLDTKRYQEARKDFLVTKALTRDKKMIQDIDSNILMIDTLVSDPGKPPKTPLVAATPSPRQYTRQTPVYSHATPVTPASVPRKASLEDFYVLGGTSSSLVIRDRKGDGILLSGTAQLLAYKWYYGERLKNGRIVLYQDKSGSGQQFSYTSRNLQRAKVTELRPDNTVQFNFSDGSRVETQGSFLKRLVKQNEDYYVMKDALYLDLFSPMNNYQRVRCMVIR